MITRLIRYPVKSMRGEEMAVARLTPRGIAGDRMWALVDVETGRVVSAKHPRKWGRVLRLAAVGNEDGTSVAITFPNGEAVSSEDAAVDEKLSAFLGRAVHLSSQPSDEMQIERADPIVGGAFVEECSREVVEKRLNAPAGSFFDYAPLHLITTVTLARMQQLSPGSSFDVARFRPNLLLELPEADAFIENTWGGMRMSIGTNAVLELGLPTPRCAVPTAAQAGLPHDPEIVRAIAAHNRVSVLDSPGACLGGYARVLRDGEIRTGDLVHIER